MKVVLAIVAAIATTSAAAFWFERQEAVDVSAASIAWGSSRSVRALADDMVAIRAGRYTIGDESPDARGDAPLRSVVMTSFAIERFEVTNRQFADFVRATGYVTTAEREGGGWIFQGGARDWVYQRDADWRHPLGPGSSID